MNVDEVIADYLAAAERGKAPRRAEWLASHPEHASELDAFLADMNRFGPLLGMTTADDLNRTVDFNSEEPSEQVAQFGGYELLGEIGRGGMGTVHRARAVGTELIVALKQVQPLKDDGSTASSFRREIEAAAGLRHPHIVPIYHVGEQDGKPFYTMALVEGGSLNSHLDRYRGNFRASATVLAKAARGVHYAHQRRLLHRDLKPANILLDEADEPRVADFGLASKLDESGAATQSGPPAGTIPWMAPEAARGEATLTTAVDVWALGVILYELLTGGRPFNGSTWKEVSHAILNQEPLAPTLIDPSVPRDLEAICLKCLAKEPEKRYESASAIALDLERWLRDEPVRARTYGRRERLARWYRRNPGLAWTGAALIGMMVAGTYSALALAREQDTATRIAVCRDNEHSAELAAGAFLRRLDQHGDFVRRASEDPRLHQACRDGGKDALLALLGEMVKDSDSPGAEGVASVLVLDPAGQMHVLWPKPAEVRSNEFAHRDYFRGALAKRGRVHMSRIFHSRNDDLDKLAVSITFRPDPLGKDWVLAATIPTDPTLGLGSRDDGRHKVVLLAPREAETEPPPYVVLVHPSYTAKQSPVPFPEGILKLEPRTDGVIDFKPDDDYADPVGDGNPEYAGRWLAGFAPVEGTEMVVLVQQRYDDAMAPQRNFLRRFALLAGGLLGVGLLAFGVQALLKRKKPKSE